ncbi:MAG: hypothetical protein BJ554DRAFT_7279, partial [Olpidium bornovanus]
MLPCRSRWNRTSPPSMRSRTMNIFSSSWKAYRRLHTRPKSISSSNRRSCIMFSTAFIFMHFSLLMYLRADGSNPGGWAAPLPTDRSRWNSAQPKTCAAQGRRPVKRLRRFQGRPRPPAPPLPPFSFPQVATASTRPPPSPWASAPSALKSISSSLQQTPPMAVAFETGGRRAPERRVLRQR